MKIKFQELRVFLSYPRNMRILLTTNFVYSLVLPILYSFIAMYIMRNTSDVSLVMSFQMANYTGLLITFFFNGFLLRIIPVHWLYSLGMLISSGSMAVMINLKQLDIVGLAIAGALMGVSFGLFWANRDYLAISSTDNANRNYYYGLESFLGTTCSIVVPFVVGWIVAGSKLYGWFGGNRNHAYFFITMAVFGLSLLASIIVCQGNFKNPESGRFLYWKYHILWYKTLLMEVFRGLGQGFMVTVPAILVMKSLGGGEGLLGVIQTVGGILTAILFYLIARFSRPQHRIWILGVGLSLFLLGVTVNAWFFNTFAAFGAIFFIASQFMATPLIECAFTPVLMQVIDVLSKRTQRSEFAYLFNNEFALYFGRIAGGFLFIGSARYLSDNFALRYILLFIGIVQFLSLFICRVVIRETLMLEKKASQEG